MWEELALRDLKGVRVCRVDLTKKESSQLKNRFAVRAFPTLLFFPPGTEDIYKFTGKRQLEPLVEFAAGGWKETEIYDPSKVPPPPPRKSFTEALWGLIVRNRIIFGLLGASMVLGILGCL